ncbi:DUF3387 domain-containing protein [Prevotella copri]|uniref:DUF3387 domain-containing protein n=1 Tax=Segatella copri TaxID=165179 RepID=UPI0022314996|nr:DUF3387 domain-containing protein [Segatella copri]MCW4080069.1 DUF3387 domain-containing protein [Segatella copri]MCW4104823.1 DUF3387 domain-containing protein [Segatella copri]
MEEIDYLEQRIDSIKDRVRNFEFIDNGLEDKRNMMYIISELADEYNTRDNLTFTNEVAHATIDAVTDIVDEKVKSLTDKLVELFKDLKADSQKFKDLGISFEEKAFFDVLVSVRDTHQFEYPEERCIELAKKIKLLVDDMTIYADFINNNSLKSKLSNDLMMLLYKSGYPPVWNQEVFQKIMEQVDNYKYNQ